MKRSVAFFSLAVLVLFAVSGIAMAADAPKLKPAINLKYSTWTGQATYVDTTGAVSTSDVVVTFSTQDGYYLSGTYTHVGIGSIGFSAIQNPMNPNEIKFTAVGHIMEGQVFKYGKKRHLALQGYDLTDGGSSVGVLELHK